jgi:hypothetical protein
VIVHAVTAAGLEMSVVVIVVAAAFQISVVIVVRSMQFITWSYVQIICIASHNPYCKIWNGF